MSDMCSIEPGFLRLFEAVRHMKAFHGFRNAQSGIAPPVATPHRPFGTIEVKALPIAWAYPPLLLRHMSIATAAMMM